ncbi:hypothetical protein F0562_004489 [Nyssa sinensis]|uniref:Protein LAZY 1 n=1 Tax=Nyssa sinensis TaxID=561372 RepID=A0A5J5C277_9ASTE|nr:hypothetical protein F0562_004489 [Nyssa sinensis]
MKETRVHASQRKPSLNDQQYYLKPSYGAARSRQPQDVCQRASSEVKTKREDEVFEEELSIMTSELFNGFLTIGTLGLEPIITEPSTPTFPMPFENITEKETEVTENELKLINDELEKFLEAEAKEVCNESSARSSHVSTITLGGKQTEGMDPQEYGDIVVCPLQGYLFGSSIELPETSIQVEKEITPVGQLFKRNKVACKYSKEKSEKGDKKIKGTYSMHFMKKMLKKLSSSSRSSAASADDKTADSVSTKKKLPKVFKMFHKKIHPERSADEKETNKTECFLTKPCQRRKSPT